MTNYNLFSSAKRLFLSRCFLARKSRYVYNNYNYHHHYCWYYHYSCNSVVWTSGLPPGQTIYCIIIHRMHIFTISDPCTPLPRRLGAYSAKSTKRNHSVTRLLVHNSTSAPLNHDWLIQQNRALVSKFANKTKHCYSADTHNCQEFLRKKLN